MNLNQLLTESELENPLTDHKIAEVTIVMFTNVDLQKPYEDYQQHKLTYPNESTQKAMKKLKFRAYHVRSVQECKEPAKENRLLYSRWFRSFVNNNGIVPHIFVTMVWTISSQYV